MTQIGNYKNCLNLKEINSLADRQALSTISPASPLTNLAQTYTNMPFFWTKTQFSWIYHKTYTWENRTKKMNTRVICSRENSHNSEMFVYVNIAQDENLFVVFSFFLSPYSTQARAHKIVFHTDVRQMRSSKRDITPQTHQGCLFYHASQEALWKTKKARVNTH